ncbi:hypothetical protein ACS0ZG_31475 [Burkholderia gladioli]|uniref:hypothetical protein n=1 Tax=Burkholderia gladioli TaxID=28095 RepID=UPI003F79CA4B
MKDSVDGRMCIGFRSLTFSETAGRCSLNVCQNSREADTLTHHPEQTAAATRIPIRDLLQWPILCRHAPTKRIGESLVLHVDERHLDELVAQYGHNGLTPARGESNRARFELVACHAGKIGDRVPSRHIGGDLGSRPQPAAATPSPRSGFIRINIRLSKQMRIDFRHPSI